MHVECNFKVIDTDKFCLVDFNMATIFQDDHAYTELQHFVSRWQQTVKKIWGGGGGGGINDMH